MSISDAINNARNKINNVYSTLEAKGAPMPSVKNLNNLSATINELPEISALNGWTYSGANGTLILKTYTGTYDSTINVPAMNGVYVNNWVNTSSSGTTDFNRQTPFYNNPNVVSVDLQKVPFVNNSMGYAFYNCQNLVNVGTLNSNVTNMSYTFALCNSLNQNIQIPTSVTDIDYTFLNCRNLINQNIHVPDSVVSMVGTYQMCYNLTPNYVHIGNSVEVMANSFQLCQNFNPSVPIIIPNSVTNMYQTFHQCFNLNQKVQIGNSVKSLVGTFNRCTKLISDVSILSEQVEYANFFFEMAGYDYDSHSYLPKNVYIPFKYSNGVNTQTFDSFRIAGYLYTNGVSNNQHGVTVYDLNAQQEEIEQND